MIGPTPGFQGRTLPLTLDADGLYYFHSEGDGIVAGLGESRLTPEPPASIPADWNQLPALVERLIRRVPHLESADATHAWAGFLETTADDNPIVGWTHLRNVYTAAGFSGHGMSIAPGLAPHVASEIRGEAPGMSLEIYRLERFLSGSLKTEGIWGATGISGDQS